MIKQIVTVFLFSIPSIVLAQRNLVANPGFENAYNTDSASRGVSFKWNFLEDYMPGKSEWGHFYRIESDIFDPVPDHSLGYQMPQEGTSYAGLGVYDKTFEFRDYLVGTLNEPLEKGSVYKVSFFLSLPNCCQYAINSFGVSFSHDSILQLYSKKKFTLLNELPVYFEYNGAPITDTTSWVKIEGEFVAKGFEQKIVIGCFRPDEELTVKKVKCKKCRNGDESLQKSAYYFIDNINLQKK